MRLAGWRVPIEQVSASSLSTYISCPEAWRQRYLLKRRETMNQAKFIGIVDHQTHEWNFRQKIQSGVDLPLETMLKTYETAWESVAVTEGEPAWDEDPQKTFARGEKMISLYHEKVSPQITPIAVEQRFEETVSGVPVPVVGYVDVETKDSIRERKTTGTRLSAPKPRWRFQGRIYQLALDKPVQWDIITKQVTPQVVTSQEAPELFLPIQNKDTTVRLLQQAVQSLADTFDRYGADSPWPTNGLFAESWACKMCSYRSNCIAWS